MVLNVLLGSVASKSVGSGFDKTAMLKSSGTQLTSHAQGARLIAEMEASSLAPLLDFPIEGCAILAERMEDQHQVNLSSVLGHVSSFFTGGHVRMDKWVSHFAVRIFVSHTYVDEETGKKVSIEPNFRLERVKEGVIVTMVPAHNLQGQEREGRYVAKEEFGKKVTLRQVLTFAANQATLNYDFVSKNCKHFVYDMLRECGVHERFEHFCGTIEWVL